MTAREAATRLGITERTIRRALAPYELPTNTVRPAVQLIQHEISQKY